MDNIKFKLLNYPDSEKMLPALFGILYDNMSIIAPTGNTYETDLTGWSACIADALKNPVRQIVLIYADSELAGFFMYYYSNGTLKMEEIQFLRRYHGSGLFGHLYGWLTSELCSEPTHVIAYANKKNLKSQAILRRLGLSETGENTNGSSLRFEGGFDIIAARYGKKHVECI